MIDYLNLRTCPACLKDKQPGIIVCLNCWPKLKESTVKALLKADVYAVGRRKELYHQIEKGYTIENIIVPVSKEYEREPVKRRQKTEELPGQTAMKFLNDMPREGKAKNIDEILPG